MLMMMCFATGFSQVKYSKGTDKVVINVVKEDSTCYLNFIYTSEKKSMVDTPKLLIKLFDEEIISLQGKILDVTKKSEGGVVVGNVVVPINKIVSEAKFPISKSQIQQFAKGIKKVRLNTSPKFHEKVWTKDKIGKKLYSDYTASGPNSFNDGF